MTDTTELRSFTQSWERLINEKKWDDAILVGIGAYLFFSGQNNERLKDASLGLVHVTFELMHQKSDGSQKRCSFCGLDDSQVRLGAGASAFICENCVQTFSGIFAK